MVNSELASEVKHRNRIDSSSDHKVQRKLVLHIQIPLWFLGGFVGWFCFLFLIASAGPEIQFEVAIKIAHEVYLGSFKIIFLCFQINTTAL